MELRWSSGNAADGLRHSRAPLVFRLKVGDKSDMKIPEFCEKLEKAEAHSEFVIAAFCDIRNFSEFSRNVESADTSTFLKHFYVKLLREYFQDAVFAKPTGDGLLIIFRHNETNLNKISELVLTSCFKALKHFPTMFKSLPIINYAPPTAIGFGVARGSASYLTFQDEILDYSGKVLNLAARLNELAKPSGVVIDGNYQGNIIPQKLRKRFRTKSVYLRGIAEEEPIEILYSSETSLPTEALHPLKEHTWVKKDKIFTVQQLSTISRFTVHIPTPLSRAKIKAECRWPSSVESNISFIDCPHEYKVDGNGSGVVFDLAEASAAIARHNLEPESPFTLRVHYVPKVPPRAKVK